MAVLFSRALVSAMSDLWNLSASRVPKKSRSNLLSKSPRKSSAIRCQRSFVWPRDR